MTASSDNPGIPLAEELRQQSERDGAVTPIDTVLDVAKRNLSEDQCFRLLCRLWTLKRLMYYIYGGWAQGINLNEYPPAAAYLFGKQIYDESTHEMQFADEILRRRWVRTQKQLFAHPYAQFRTATRTGAYIFCLRALACGLCREACPERAVHPKMQDIHHMYEVIEAECTGCADCLPYCPVPGALEEYEPKAIGL